jgi:hypothetical protein
MLAAIIKNAVTKQVDGQKRMDFLTCSPMTDLIFGEFVKDKMYSSQVTSLQ